MGRTPVGGAGAADDPAPGCGDISSSRHLRHDGYPPRAARGATGARIRATATRARRTRSGARAAAPTARAAGADGQDREDGDVDRLGPHREQPGVRAGEQEPEEQRERDAEGQQRPSRARKCPRGRRPASPATTTPRLTTAIGHSPRAGPASTAQAEPGGALGGLDHVGQQHRAGHRADAAGHRARGSRRPRGRPGATSPTSPASVRVMPTSSTAAPGLTMSAVIRCGHAGRGHDDVGPRGCARRGRGCRCGTA